MGPGQYISLQALSWFVGKKGCLMLKEFCPVLKEFVQCRRSLSDVWGSSFPIPLSMDECCLVSDVVALTSVRVVGRCGLSSPRAKTYVVWAASVKSFVMDLSLVCHVR